jgi:acyl carrier protein
MGIEVSQHVQRIVKLIPARIADRGLHAVDSSTIVRMALRSLLLWERTNGHLMLERLGVDPFDLARSVDRLIEEGPVGYPASSADWDFDTLVEPLLRQAIHEAERLGRPLVSVEHLLLAIIFIADPALSSLLQDDLIVYSRAWEIALDLPLDEEAQRKQEWNSQSLTKCEIAIAIESQFGVSLLDTDVMSWRTVDDVNRSAVAALKERLEGWPGGEPAVRSSVRHLLARGYGVSPEAIVGSACLFDDLKLHARGSFREDGHDTETGLSSSSGV